MFSLLGQVSEKIQTNTERLSHCVALWDDLKAMEQDINQWTSCSIAELTDSVTKLSDKERTETQLDAFQVRECAYEYIYIFLHQTGSCDLVALHSSSQAGIEEREQKLDALQDRVTKLKEQAKLQEPPIQIQVRTVQKRNTGGGCKSSGTMLLNVIVLKQVLESDMRKKMAHAQEVFNQAKHTLTYFSFQKQRLEDFMTQMADRLEAIEGSLSDLTEATSPEDIGTVKV